MVQRLRGEMFELVTRLTMTFDYEKGRFVISGDGNWVGSAVVARQCCTHRGQP